MKAKIGDLIRIRPDAGTAVGGSSPNWVLAMDGIRGGIFPVRAVKQYHGANACYVYIDRKAEYVDMCEDGWYIREEWYDLTSNPCCNRRLKRG